MAKREVHEEHENHERWLVSYADFMTLLFAFFVVMYAVSRVDNKRMVDVVKSIKFAMHFKGQGGVEAMPIFDGPASEGGCITASPDSERPSQKQIEAIEAMRRRMEKKFKGILLEKPGLNTAVTLHVEGRKLMVRLSVARFFDPQQAALRPEVIPVLDAVATELARMRRPIRVGHPLPRQLGPLRLARCFGRQLPRARPQHSRQPAQCGWLWRKPSRGQQRHARRPRTQSAHRSSRRSAHDRQSRCYRALGSPWSIDGCRNSLGSSERQPQIDGPLPFHISLHRETSAEIALPPQPSPSRQLCIHAALPSVQPGPRRRF